MMRPKSNEKLWSVLFLPTSMSGSLTLKFLDSTYVVSPVATKFPSMRTPPCTTSTLEPVSFTHKFEPTLKVCPGDVFATPTGPAVTRERSAFDRDTVSVVTLP